MLPEQAVGAETTFTLEVVLQLVTLGFVLGGIYVHFRDVRARMGEIETRVTALEKKVIKRHWFANWLAVFQLQNPTVQVTKPDDIKSPE